MLSYLIMERTEDRTSKFIIPEKTGAIYSMKNNPDNNKEELPFKLIEKMQITHDTFIFTFHIPDDQYLGINIGQHIAIE